MSCSICGRAACMRSFHSISQQEEWDELSSKGERWLINALLSVRDEVNELKKEIDRLLSAGGES